MTHRPVPALEPLLAKLLAAQAALDDALDEARLDVVSDVGILCVGAILRSRPEYGERAAVVARTRQDRQRVAVLQSLTRGDLDRAAMLAREHLAEFPEDTVVRWLTRPSAR